MTTASDSCTRDIRYKFTEIAACFDTEIGIIVFAGGRCLLPLLAFYIGPHRQHYGLADQSEPAIEYIHLTVINRDKGLLASMNKTISEIAYQAEFQYLHHLIRLFKKVAGAYAE